MTRAGVEADNISMTFDANEIAEHCRKTCYAMLAVCGILILATLFQPPIYSLDAAAQEADFLRYLSDNWEKARTSLIPKIRQDLNVFLQPADNGGDVGVSHFVRTDNQSGPVAFPLSIGLSGNTLQRVLSSDSYMEIFANDELHVERPRTIEHFRELWNRTLWRPFHVQRIEKLPESGILNICQDGICIAEQVQIVGSSDEMQPPSYWSEPLVLAPDCNSGIWSPGTDFELLARQERITSRPCRWEGLWGSREFDAEDLLGQNSFPLAISEPDHRGRGTTVEVHLYLPAELSISIKHLQSYLLDLDLGGEKPAYTFDGRVGENFSSAFPNLNYFDRQERLSYRHVDDLPIYLRDLDEPRDEKFDVFGLEISRGQILQFGGLAILAMQIYLLTQVRMLAMTAPKIRLWKTAWVGVYDSWLGRVVAVALIMAPVVANARVLATTSMDELMPIATLAISVLVSVWTVLQLLPIWYADLPDWACRLLLGKT